MTWEAIIVAVSLVGMHAAWGVAYWCRRRLAEAHETHRDKLWCVEQQRDATRAELDYAIARHEKSEHEASTLLKSLAEARQCNVEMHRKMAGLTRERDKLISDLNAAEENRELAIERMEQAEQDNRRLRALRTRITEMLHEHDHPGTVEVTVNTMCKGAGDDD